MAKLPYSNEGLETAIVKFYRRVGKFHMDPCAPRINRLGRKPDWEGNEFSLCEQGYV